MYYRHNLDCFKYPDKSDEHMITVKHLRDVTCDENYPYREKGFWFKIKRIGLWLLLNTVVFPVCTIRHGVRIHGKENYKKHKKEFKNGAITVANHVFMWDYICILKAIRPHLQHHIAWKTNLEGPNGGLIRWVGGMPIPTDNMRAMVKFNKAVIEVLNDGKWLHVFPEGSMWFFYPDIRPFKKGVFKYAVRCDKPVLPMAFTFRPRKGILKIFSNRPLVDLHIGEPLYADKTLKETEAIDDLHARTYKVVQELAGITPDSPYYNEDQNIENYKKTM